LYYRVCLSEVPLALPRKSAATFHLCAGHWLKVTASLLLMLNAPVPPLLRSTHRQSRLHVSSEISALFAAACSALTRHPKTCIGRWVALLACLLLALALVPPLRHLPYSTVFWLRVSSAPKSSRQRS